MCSSFVHVAASGIKDSFLRLNNIPLYREPTFSLSPHELIDIWVWIFFFFRFLETVSLLCNPGWPWTWDLPPPAFWETGIINIPLCFPFLMNYKLCYFEQLCAMYTYKWVCWVERFLFLLTPSTWCLSQPHLSNTNWVFSDSVQFWHWLSGVSIRSHKLKDFTTAPTSDANSTSWDTCTSDWLTIYWNPWYPQKAS
jgi:hypothetical protein